MKSQSDKQDQAVISVILNKPLRVSARGEWFEGDEPFTNSRVQRLFERSVCWRRSPSGGDGGDWVVRIGNQEAVVDCPGAPVFVAGLSGDTCLQFTSDHFAPLQLASVPQIIVSADEQWAIDCPVPNAAHETRVRFLPAAQQQLSEWVVLTPDGTEGQVKSRTGYGFRCESGVVIPFVYE